MADPRRVFIDKNGNERILGSDAARAVGRFRPDGLLGFVSRAGGPIRATRAEAEADYVETFR